MFFSAVYVPRELKGKEKSSAEDGNTHFDADADVFC